MLIFAIEHPSPRSLRDHAIHRSRPPFGPEVSAVEKPRPRLARSLAQANRPAYADHEQVNPAFWSVLARRAWRTDVRSRTHARRAAPDDRAAPVRRSAIRSADRPR